MCVKQTDPEPRINREQFDKERKYLIQELKKALGELRSTQSVIPICSKCKKIRDSRGYWNRIESYFHQYAELKFSHGICPVCAKALYPEIELYK